MQSPFQNIINQLQNKNFSKAILLCEAQLRTTNHPQLHLFLAIAHGEQGSFNQAEKIFENLIRHFPQNPEIYYNYALILQKNRRLDQALEKYQLSLRLHAGNPSAWNNVGEIYRQQNKFTEAIHAFQQCLQISPNQVGYLQNLATAYYQNENFSMAQPLLVKAVMAGDYDEEMAIATLDTLVSLRQLRLATDVGKRILSKFQDDAEILNLLGLNELEKRKFNTSINFFKKSLLIKPQFLSAMCHLASAYLFAGKAKKGFKLLAKITANKSEKAYVFVSMMYEKNNKSKKLKKILKLALKQFPDNQELLLFKARALKKSKKYKKSLAVLSHLLVSAKKSADPSLSSSIAYEKGHVLDKLKRYDLAWQHYKQANADCVFAWKKHNPEADMFIQTCQQILSSDPSKVEPMIGLESDAGKELVFIVGFPRSGTTLLDSLVSAHTEITVLEEAPIIGETFDQIKGISAENYLHKLSVLEQEELTYLREFYFNSLKDYSDWNGKGVLVDKSPLNTMHVGLIHTLFPQAKIVFSQRHPLDVSLSCFFQDFKMNSFMLNMTSIKQTALTYDAMLKVWDKSVKTLNINVYYQSYESLVSDFEAETRKLFAYLQMEWQEGILSFQDTLKSRGTISTPSYDQVSQAIYQTAKYRHLNYQDYLKEASEILNPWVEYFSYCQIPISQI